MTPSRPQVSRPCFDADHLMSFVRGENSLAVEALTGPETCGRDGVEVRRPRHNARERLTHRDHYRGLSGEIVPSSGLLAVA